MCFVGPLCADNSNNTPPGRPLSGVMVVYERWPPTPELEKLEHTPVNWILRIILDTTGIGNVAARYVKNARLLGEWGGEATG